MAGRLSGLTVRVPARAGDGGRLFGRVTTADVAAAVTAAGGPELDRRRIELPSSIKTTGEHTVTVRVHPEVTRAAAHRGRRRVAATAPAPPARGVGLRSGAPRGVCGGLQWRPCGRHVEQTTSVLIDHLGFPEAPRWHDGRFWFSDFHDRVVRSTSPVGGRDGRPRSSTTAPPGSAGRRTATCSSSP